MKDLEVVVDEYYAIVSEDKIARVRQSVKLEE